MTLRREETVWIPESDLEGMSVDTLAVRAGQIRTGQLEHSDAIFPTSSFVYGSAAQAAARFGGDEPGNIYSRFTNPTVQAFEARIAAMEGGERAVATASGMAAILSTCMALLHSGDHVVCSRGVFGTTNVLFQKYMARFGVETSFVSLTDMEEWRASVRPETRMLFIETPSNPLCEVADMARLAQLACDSDALFVVDNCFCTPVLQRPLEQGADIVIHSATKYLDGQGRCVGGVVVGSEKMMEECSIIPELPDTKKARFVEEFGIREYDAIVLTSTKELADYFETASKNIKNKKQVSHWVMGPVLGLLKAKSTNIINSPVSPEMLAELMALIENKTITAGAAKTVFEEMVSSDKKPLAIVKEKGLEQVKDNTELENIINQVIEANPNELEAYRNGKTKLFGFFMGQIMKKTRGKADPGIVTELLKSKL